MEKRWKPVSLVLVLYFAASTILNAQVIEHTTIRNCWCGLFVVRCDYGPGICEPQNQEFCDELCGPGVE